MFIVEPYQRHDVRAYEYRSSGCYRMGDDTVDLPLKRIPFTVFLSPENNVYDIDVVFGKWIGDKDKLWADPKHFISLGGMTGDELDETTYQRRSLTELIFRTYAEYATKDCYEQGKFDVCWLDGMRRAALAMGAYTINADCNKAGMVFFDVFDPNGEQHTEYAEKGEAASLYNQIIKRVEGELDEAWVAGMSWFPHKREN